MQSMAFKHGTFPPDLPVRIMGAGRVVRERGSMGRSIMK